MGTCQKRLPKFTGLNNLVLKPQFLYSTENFTLVEVIETLLRIYAYIQGHIHKGANFKLEFLEIVRKI